QRALLEARAHVSRVASRERELEAIVREPRTGGAHVLGDAGRAGGRTDGSEPDGVVRGDDADVGEPVLERRVEDELAPSGARRGAKAVDFRARCAGLFRVQREGASADADGSEQEAVTGERRVESP